MQERFRTPYFKVPQISNVYENEFTMAEVPNAVHAAAYLSELKDIEAEIMLYRDFIRSNITGEAVFHQAPFIRKILQIINRLTRVEDIRLCEQVAVGLKSEYVLPTGQYHGDFTLVNILYPGPWLIDFTPAYIESPIVDVVKLKQEYKLCWSEHVTNVNKRGYKLVCYELAKVVENSFSQYDTRTIEALNLLRVLPYARHEDLRDLLRKNIKQLL